MMRKSEKIEDLIFKSVKQSNLFDGEWESMMYSNLLKMIIIKGGGIEEFIQHYSPYFDVSDLEYYFKDDFTKRYGEDGYQLLLDFIGDIGNER